MSSTAAMREYSYTVVFENAPEGGYNVVVPAIPEICTFGESVEEARAMALDAIQCFLESARVTREPIPADVEAIVEQVALTIP